MCAVHTSVEFQVARPGAGFWKDSSTFMRAVNNFAESAALLVAATSLVQASTFIRLSTPTANVTVVRAMRVEQLFAVVRRPMLLLA